MARPIRPHCLLDLVVAHRHRRLERAFLTPHLEHGFVGVARFELRVVALGKLSGRAVELDLAECDDGAAFRRGLGRRRRRRFEGSSSEEEWLQHKCQSGYGEERTDRKGENHSSPRTAASTRASSSAVATMPTADGAASAAIAST